MYHGSLAYENKDWGFSAMITGHYMGPYYWDQYNESEKREGSKWGDLAFSQTLMDGNCTLYLGVKNFSDRQYSLLSRYNAPWSPDDYYPAQGRTVYGGIKASLDFHRMRMPTLADVNRMGRRLYGMADQGRAGINGMFGRLRNTMPF
jgi:iron complex outermembrane receptor protein